MTEAEFFQKCPDQKLIDWYKGRPAKVQAAMLRFPPWECYRMKDNPGHYRLIGYTEQIEGAVTLKLEHSGDSYAAGFAVFGIEETQLEICGCGQWKEATDDEFKSAQRRVKEFARLERMKQRGWR